SAPLRVRRFERSTGVFQPGLYWRLVSTTTRAAEAGTSPARRVRSRGRPPRARGRRRYPIMSPTADRHSRDPVATSTVSRMIGVVDAIVSARGDKPRRGSRRTLHDTRFAAAAVGMALLLIAIGVEHYWLRDLKFDDAWIHFRYARNLAQGKGFVYNDGERVLGSGG